MTASVRAWRQSPPSPPYFITRYIVTCLIRWKVLQTETHLASSALQHLLELFSSLICHLWGSCRMWGLREQLKRKTCLPPSLTDWLVTVPVPSVLLIHYCRPDWAVVLRSMKFLPRIAGCMEGSPSASECGWCTHSAPVTALLPAPACLQSAVSLTPSSISVSSECDQTAGTPTPPQATARPTPAASTPSHHPVINKIFPVPQWAESEVKTFCFLDMFQWRAGAGPEWRTGLEGKHGVGEQHQTSQLTPSSPTYRSQSEQSGESGKLLAPSGVAVSQYLVTGYA